MKVLLIIGPDKIGLAALRKLKIENGTKIVFDSSTSFRRILKLIIKRRISIKYMLRMMICEYLRTPEFKDPKIPSIRSNKDLEDILSYNEIDRIVLFRAGLIIEHSIIRRNIPVLNIHAASIPDYGGLGSIQRAINDGSFEQKACLHEVTTRIDEGAILDFETYQLKRENSYCLNESIAYQAATKLLQRTLGVG